MSFLEGWLTGRGALSMGTHGLGQSFLRVGALALLTSAGGLTAAPLNARQLVIEAGASTLQCDFMARRVKPHRALFYLRPRLLCQGAGSAGVESKSAPETFVDLLPDELAKQVHELKHLTPADSQAMLPMILQRVGATVENFLDGFPNTACSERITSEVENRAVDLAVNTTGYGTTLARAPLQRGAKFNYIALAKAGNKEAPLTEYRTDAKGRPAQLRDAIITSGFVSLIAHFRPAFQKESRFRYLGRELVKNQNTYVVAFAQRPEVARQPERVRFQDKTGYVFLQGVAWIDPMSFAILRLRTEILQPELDVGLQRETTEVEYFPVTFKRDRKTLWLPREVTVSGQLERFAFFNQHRYSQYRLFVVEAGANRKNP